MSEQKYIVVLKGKPTGPFTLLELAAFPLKAHDFVKIQGDKEFVELHQIPALKAFFQVENVLTAPQYFASFDQRLLACFVDYFIFGTIYALFLVVIFLIQGDVKQLYLLLMYAFPIIYGAKLLVNTALESGSLQASLGKQLLQLRVMKADGKALNFSTSLGRNILKIISFAPLCAGYFYIFTNKKSQAFHDKLCHTVIAKTRLK